MSLLVQYRLKSKEDHTAQIEAMQTLVSDLKRAGIDGLNYSCYSTENDCEFLGILEFDSDETFKQFQASTAFEAYRERVGPTFANPPETVKIFPIATTRS